MNGGRCHGVLGVTLTLLTVAELAVAQPDEIQRHGRDESARHPTGTAEFGIGWLTLPGAEVCVERDVGSCRKGDSSFALDAWQIFRLRPDFALGAGVTLGLTPVTDAPRLEPEGVERDHSRRYFTAETGARYYPWIGDRLEVWVGIIGGLAVVSDTFSVADPADDRALIGSRGVTIRTEGVTLGLGGGMSYALSPRWLVGTNLRYASWFLPGTPETNSFGDEASLVGRNSAIIVGVHVAYRVAL